MKRLECGLLELFSLSKITQKSIARYELPIQCVLLFYKKIHSHNAAKLTAVNCTLTTPWKRTVILHAIGSCLIGDTRVYTHNPFVDTISRCEKKYRLVLYFKLKSVNNFTFVKNCESEKKAGGYAIRISTTVPNHVSNAIPFLSQQRSHSHFRCLPYPISGAFLIPFIMSSHLP